MCVNINKLILFEFNRKILADKNISTLKRLTMEHLDK